MEHNENPSTQPLTNPNHPDYDPATLPREKSSRKSQKSSTGLIIGMAICSVLAIVGIGFGVYGMMESSHKSSEIDQLRVEISDKDNQLATFETDGLTLSEDGTTVNISDSAFAVANPVIAATSPEIYVVNFNSATTYQNGAPSHVSLQIRDGAISGCTVYSDTTVVNTNCSVEGIDGSIYKIVNSGEGQNASGEVAIIMTDGSVQYFDSTELITNGTAAIKGTYAIDGPVIDAIETGVYQDGQPTGGYGTTLFVLADGTLVPYGSISK